MKTFKEFLNEAIDHLEFKNKTNSVLHVEYTDGRKEFDKYFNISIDDKYNKSFANFEFTVDEFKNFVDSLKQLKISK